MAKLKIDNGTISKTAWGKVDKSALGKRLAEMYAAGEATKAQIREVYAHVPDDAFGEDADGNPEFAYSKAWGPHHEVTDGTIVLNRAGVQVAAAALGGARAVPALSDAEKGAAGKHLQRHYKSHLKEDLPDSLAERRRVLGKGAPLEELVKGSLEYTSYAIRQAFRQQFRSLNDRYDYWVEEIFADYVIVRNYELPADEYYFVRYERGADGGYVFADREDWEIVELTYQLQMVERQGRSEGERFTETIGSVRLLDEDEQNPDGPWRVRAVGITADVVNENGRRYPAPVLDAAIQELRTHLHESAGQGRVLQLYGESEHPSMKAARRPFLPEVVLNWDKVAFDGQQILLEGNLLGTAKGKDIRAQMVGGVVPGVSQRAYGESHTIKADGQRFEEVDWVVITGYDLTVEPSDPQAGITMFESRDQEETMDLEKLKAQYPELVAQILEEHDEKRRQELEEALKRKAEEDARIKKLVAGRETELRTALGLDETADLVQAVAGQKERLVELEETNRKREVAEYIESQIGEIKYPEWLKKQMTEAVQELAPQTVEEAKKVIVAKRKEYDGIMARVELAAQGHPAGVQVLGPVLEREAGVPAYAAAAFELQESMRRSGMVRRWDARQPANVNEVFAKLYLERFDEVYKTHLLREQREFEEAEQASDLSLPYTVSRAVVAEAFPLLVATSIFDFDTTEQGTFRLYFETYAGETGYTGTVTDEAATADHDDWVALTYKRITPGTVVVTNSGGTVTYTLGSDYVIDHANGQIMALSTGSITDSQALLVDYQYTAIRKGEMAAIERGKLTLSYVLVDAAADRLATQISSEAIVFSRAQMGFDAVARTLASLVRQVQRKIDQGLLYLALNSALSVADNSGGTWDSANDSLDDLVELMGLAKVKVYNRYYEPTSFVISVTNADRLSNWTGFKRDGFPDAVLNANGFVGRVKGLPVFQSTEFSDGYIMPVNRELVMHRVFQPMVIKGPYPSYDVSGGTSKIIAADQYYAEEYNASESPVSEKGAYLAVI